MVRGIVLMWDGSVRAVVLPDDTMEMGEALRIIVGGFIENIDLSVFAPDCHAYINEEGKLQGIPPNELATLLAHRAGIAPNDWIAGNMILLGSNGPEEASLSGDAVKAIWEFVGSAIAAAYN